MNTGKVADRVFAIAAGIIVVATITTVLNPGGRGVQGTVSAIRGLGDLFAGAVKTVMT